MLVYIDPVFVDAQNPSHSKLWKLGAAADKGLFVSFILVQQNVFVLFFCTLGQFLQ